MIDQRAMTGILPHGRGKFWWFLVGPQARPGRLPGHDQLPATDSARHRVSTDRKYWYECIEKRDGSEDGAEVFETPGTHGRTIALATASKDIGRGLSIAAYRADSITLESTALARSTNHITSGPGLGVGKLTIHVENQCCSGTSKA